MHDFFSRDSIVLCSTLEKQSKIFFPLMIRSHAIAFERDSIGYSRDTKDSRDTTTHVTAQSSAHPAAHHCRPELRCEWTDTRHSNRRRPRHVRLCVRSSLRPRRPRKRTAPRGGPKNEGGDSQDGGESAIFYKECDHACFHRIPAILREGLRLDRREDNATCHRIGELEFPLCFRQQNELYDQKF